MHSTLYLLASFWNREKKKHTYRKSVSQTMLYSGLENWQIRTENFRSHLWALVCAQCLSCSTNENISSKLSHSVEKEVMKIHLIESFHFSALFIQFSLCLEFFVLKNKDESLKHYLDWWICTRKNRRWYYLQMPSCKYTKVALIVRLHSIDLLHLARFKCRGVVLFLFLFHFHAV